MQGELGDADGVATAVRRIFADEKLNKPQVLVSDTDNLIRLILQRDRDVLRELLTTDRAFVNTRYDTNKREIARGHDKDPIHLS